MKKNVLLLEPIAAQADEVLRKHTCVFEAYREESPLEIAAENTIHAIVTRGKGQVNRELIEACPHLQVISRCGVGLDNIDVDEATKRKVYVVNAPGSNADTIAEHTLTLILMLVRNVWKSAERVRAEQWEWRNGYTGDEIRGKILGILGMGNIGRRVARLADAFGMQVIFWDKYPVKTSYTSAGFDEVLQNAEILSIHVPLVEETHQMINEREFSLMKKGTYLINTARGGLICEEALLTALNNDTLAGFAADVLTEEPPTPGYPVIAHPKALITPHTGSLTATTYRHMCVSTIENTVAILASHKPNPDSVFNKDMLEHDTP